MGALTEELRGFLDANRVGVLATLAPDGRPRQSLVYFARDGERLLISTLADRLKARRREADRVGVAVRDGPRAAISIGDVLGPGRDPHRATSARATAEIMQRITDAAEPPEPMSDEALAEVGRVLLAITIDRVTAANYIPSPTGQAETRR